MINKWKTLKSELVLNEKWYRVRKETVEVEPGKIIDDYYLGVFNDIVLIVALTEDRQIPLVRQYKHGAGDIITELPAGYIDDNEDPLSAAQRELKEETGYTSPTWHKLGHFYKNPTKTRGENLHLYLALDAQKTADQQLDENEHIEVTVTPLQRALAQAQQGSIQGSDSALALFLTSQFLIVDKKV